ncbi:MULTISPECIES: hypothetical protein [Acutalibacteraceae]|nr:MULTISPECIES: hypothetical protein [Acutalibacteraceae]
MDKELKQQLEWMNTNLNTIAMNQAILYTELEQIKERLPQSDEPTG